MFKTTIADYETKRKLKIDENGALLASVIVPPPPPPGTSNKQRFYTALLGSGGADTGTLSQKVDGSVAPQTFYVGASDEFDIHIIQITVLIIDAGVKLNKFGGIAALATGWDLVLKDAGQDTFVVTKAKTSGDLVLQSGFSNSFGSGASAFIITNWLATSDASVANLDVGSWVPGGLRIGRGTLDQLTAVVNDDLTGLDDMFVRVFGYRNYPVVAS